MKTRIYICRYAKSEPTFKATQNKPDIRTEPESLAEMRAVSVDDSVLPSLAEQDFLGRVWKDASIVWVR